MAGIDHKSSMFHADLCIANTCPFQAALVNQERCIAADRTLERTACTRQFQRLLCNTLIFQLLHLFPNVCIFSGLQLQGHTRYNLFRTGEHAVPIGELQFLRRCRPKCSRFVQIFYTADNVFHLSAVRSGIHIDCSANRARNPCQTFHARQACL